MLPKTPGRWMSLDVGSRRIGVALSDPLRLTARPLTTLTRSVDYEELTQITELAEQYEVTRIVIGRPLYLTGESSESTHTTEQFAERLRLVCGRPIDWAEERLSSKEAESLMAEMDIDPAERKGLRDQFAAALILKWYLEEHGAQS